MIFDGPSLLIILEASDGDSVAAAALYSRWKDWVSSGAGAGFPPAFVTIGGEDLGGGLSAGAYFFLQTQSGWQVRPREESHELTVVGNLYPSVAGADQFAQTLGAYQVAIALELSSLTQQTSSASPSGDLSTILVRVTELWQRHGLDAANPVIFADGSHRVPADGSVIDQVESVDGSGAVTVTRQ